MSARARGSSVTGPVSAAVAAPALVPAVVRAPAILTTALGRPSAAVVAVLARRMVQRVDEQVVVGDLVGQLEADVALDALESFDVLLARQADRLPGRAGPRRPPDAVDVVLGVERQ